MSKNTYSLKLPASVKKAVSTAAAELAANDVSYSKESAQFCQDILRSFFLKKMTAIESLSRH
jgi:hypothetical protein